MREHDPAPPAAALPGGAEGHPPGCEQRLPPAMRGKPARPGTRRGHGAGERVQPQRAALREGQAGTAAAGPAARLCRCQPRGQAEGLGQAGGRGGGARRKALPLGSRHRAAAARPPAAAALERAGERPAKRAESCPEAELPPAPRLGWERELGARSRPRRRGRGSRPPRSPGRLPGSGAPPPAPGRSRGAGATYRTAAREDGPAASAAGSQGAVAAAGASGAGPPRLRVCGGGLLPAPAPGRPGAVAARPGTARPPGSAPARPPQPFLGGSASAPRTAPQFCGAGLVAPPAGTAANNPRHWAPGWVPTRREGGAINTAPRNSEIASNVEFPGRCSAAGGGRRSRLPPATAVGGKEGVPIEGLVLSSLPSGLAW